METSGKLSSELMMEFERLLRTEEVLNADGRKKLSEIRSELMKRLATATVK